MTVVDASELRDGVEDVRRRRRRVTVSPFRHAVVDPDQLRVRADQVREHAEQHAAADRDDHRERQREPGRGRRVEPRAQEGAEIRMSPDRLADLARGIECREPAVVGATRGYRHVTNPTTEPTVRASTSKKTKGMCMDLV